MVVWGLGFTKNPNMEFIGTLQKSRFWQFKVGVRV